MVASAFVSIFKKDKPASVSSYEPTPILNNSLNLCEFVTYSHIPHYLKFRLLHLPKSNRPPNKPRLPRENAFI